MNKVHMIRYSLRISKDKLVSIRTLSLFLVVLFFFYTRLSPLREFVTMVHYKITPWIFPCLLSNLSFQLIIAFCGAYFFSEVPYMQYKEMYQMIRCGRVKWAIAHIISIFELSCILSAVMVFFSIILLIPKISLSLEWGQVINTLSLTNAAQYLPFAVPYKLINGFTPVQAMGISFLLLMGMFFLIGLLMFAISLVLSRIYAVAAITLLAAWAVIISNMIESQRIFSYFSPLLWLNIADINTRVQGMYTLPSYGYICGTLIGLTTVLSFIIVWRIRTIDCNWVNEE